MKHEDQVNKFYSIEDALNNILRQEIAKNQNELLNLLNTQGFKTNQSKISRLLQKLDAIKTRNSKGEIVYSLLKESAPPTATANMAKLVVKIVANENLIVVHTNPGSAPLIARLLDYKQSELGILGTIAGDDAIFIAPVSVKRISLVIIAVKKALLSA